MQTERPASQDKPLYVRTQGSDRMLQAGPRYRIGRDPDSDIVVADPRVSWQHAVLRLAGDSWLLEDCGSTNGTFAGPSRVQQLPITGDCVVRLGHPHDGPAVTCSLGLGAGLATPSPGSPAPPAPPPRPPSAVRSLPEALLRIGRASGNDVVVRDLSVSRYHAQLRKTTRGGYEIVDLDSGNGTFLNGQRITAAPVAELDLIGVGPATFRLVDGHLQEFLDTGDISLAARDLTVTLPGGKMLLDHVSFTLGERCLLGVIGPSGAGKSTLLGSLTGMPPASGGSVLYDNRDLYAHYAELRHRIGLVPQENILHTQLTPRRALAYAAELRFPRDTSKPERQQRITEVLAELSLTGHANTRISALSGGQQKRVNVALELLTRPSLLFLDEPTSGLDPGLDKSVMEQLASLAHDGRTVIVVTHSVANLHLCDRLLVLVPGGKIAYFGPPADGLRHFAQPGWAEVFQAFDTDPGRDWAGDYHRSPYYQRYIARELDTPPPMSAVSRETSVRPPARNHLAQLSTLCRRYLAVIASDRTYLAALALLPVILGCLTLAVPARLGLAGRGNLDAQSLLIVLVIGACFTGAANSVRELIKERAIYTRERAAGMSAGVYLTSKLVVLAAISAIQAAVLVMIGLIGRKLPPTGSFLRHLPLLELLLAMVVLAIVSMTLGLLISTLVNSTDKTMPLLVVVVMFQIILTGGIFSLTGKAGLDQLATVSPSRWGFGAVASTVNLNVIQRLPAQPTGLGNPPSVPRGRPTGPEGTSVVSDPLWAHTPATWLRNVGLMASLGLLFSLLAWWRLIRIKPGRRR